MSVFQGNKITSVSSISSYDADALIPIAKESAGVKVWHKISLSGLKGLINENVIYPEDYGAVGDGTTDDTTAITNALTAAIGKRIVFTKAVYKVTAKIEIDLDGDSIDVVGYAGSTIYTTLITGGGDYQTQTGAINFYNGGNVYITGMKFLGTNDVAGVRIVPGLAQGDGNNFLSLLRISSCDNVTIENSIFTEGIYAGLLCYTVDKIALINSGFSYCNYAGAFIYHAGQSYIVGNNFSYNGISSYAYGYGISLSHRFGAEVDNEGIYLAGNKAYYNTRKGIDLHGGLAGKVIGNHVKGFATAGIGAVNEAGSDPDNPSVIDPLWAKRITDLTIAYNEIENDLTWLATLTNDYLNHIQVGSSGDTDFGGGAIKVIGNILRNCNASNQRAPIYAFINTDGTATMEISIKDNTIMDADVITTEFGDFSTQDGVIYVVEGTVTPLFIDVSGNKIQGNSTNGIKIYTQNPDTAQNNTVKVTNNDLYGTISHPIFITRDLRQRSQNNTLNGELLPDMIDAFNGILNAKIETGASSSYKDLLSINANNFKDGCALFEIKIIAVGANSKRHVIYNYSALAKNDANVAAFSVYDMESYGVVGDSEADPPAVSWQGSGDIRTLRVTCPVSYTNYFINISFSSWRLQLWSIE
jgi:hypothetical protein